MHVAFARECFVVMIRCWIFVKVGTGLVLKLVCEDFISPVVVCRISDDRIKETTIVHRIFGGYTQSQVKCQCGYESNTFEPFLDLSVEITQANSVEKALAQFCAPEHLTGDNKYMCARYVSERRCLYFDFCIVGEMDALKAMMSLSPREREKHVFGS